MIEDQAGTGSMAPRRGMKNLVLTGMIVGAGSAALAPMLWELVVGSVGTSSHWLGQYIVVFVIGGLLAAPIWGAIGAVAGYCSGLIWRRQDRYGPQRTAAGMSAVVAAIFGVATGVVLGALFNSAIVGVLLGLVVAASAASGTLLTIRRLKRMQEPAEAITGRVS